MLAMIGTLIMTVLTTMAVAVLIVSVVSFALHIFNWFNENYNENNPDELNVLLDPERLDNAPTRQVGLKKKRLVQAVVNKGTKTIKAIRELEYDSLDSETEEIMGNEAIVKLE